MNRARAWLIENVSWYENLEITFLSYTIGAALARNFNGFFAHPDWEELELTDEICPRCGCDLYVERGEWFLSADVYRCRLCGFEGPKEPAYVIYEWLVSKFQKNPAIKADSNTNIEI